MSIAAAVLVWGAVACGDGGDGGAGGEATNTPAATSTAAPESSPTADASPTPGAGAPTGIDSIDAIVESVASGSAAGLADLVLFQQVACETPSGQGPGGPPPCREGEAEGTEVLVVFGASCEGFYAREDELQFQGIALADPPLYGAFRVTSESPLSQLWPDDYAVVLRRINPGGGDDLAFTLLADDQGIIGFSLGCGESPEQFVETQQLVDAIIAP
jgi:hypothetical protein